MFLYELQRFFLTGFYPALPGAIPTRLKDAAVKNDIKA
jgi:hypothetical protein